MKKLLALMLLAGSLQMIAMDPDSAATLRHRAQSEQHDEDIKVVIEQADEGDKPATLGDLEKCWNRLREELDYGSTLNSIVLGLTYGLICIFWDRIMCESCPTM